MKLSRIAMLGIVALAVSVPAGSMAYSVNIDPGTTYTIGSLTGFATYGDMMDGMTVLFEFDDIASSSHSWATTGVGSGGVSGSLGNSSWSLNLSGDTFGSPWVLSVSNAILRRLTLIGSTDYTAFDMDAPSPGTLGSANGLTFQTSSTLPITATYKNVIQIGSDPAVGDLYERLIIEFGGDGFRSDTMSFTADTDNISKGTFYQPAVPGPAAALPFGIGLLAALKRKQNRK
jgi:hypothetical protein